MTDPHPEGLGVSTCIELALKDSGIERDEVRGLRPAGHRARLAWRTASCEQPQPSCLLFHPSTPACLPTKALGWWWG